VDAVAAWIKLSKQATVKSNQDRGPVVYCTTSRSHHQLPSTATLIDGVSTTPVQNVRDFGIHIDSDACSANDVELLHCPHVTVFQGSLENFYYNSLFAYCTLVDLVVATVT